MKYDIIVLGAGSAGLNVAVFMNRIGLKVLMVEKHLIGGDCLNYGCVPSKALISLSKHMHQGKKAEQYGVQIKGSIDLKKIAQTIKKRQDFIREHENEEYFRKKGIDVKMGSAKFVDKRSISLNGEVHTAKRIVIATGSRPFTPPIDGVEKVPYFTNETIFKNEKLPKKFLVVGGGPIGMEISQAYNRLGAEVTIVERNNQVLPKEDKEMSNMICEVFKKEGIKLMLGYNPVKFSDKNTLVVSQYDREKRENVGKPISIKFDQVIIAIGRRLNIEGLSLEKANVQVKDNKIVVDKYLRTTNKHIYVAGDVAGDFLFTHWAEYQASIVINNMVNPRKKSPKRENVAWVTYVDPELASFGLQEQNLKEQNIQYEVLELKLDDVDRAIAEGSTEGKLKLFVGKGKILGGTMLAKNAGELVGELVLAMTLGIPAAKLFERIYPYPTLSRVNKKVIAKYLGKKLTSKSMSILRILYKILP
tara:strand:+ start:1470 stop:2894 length:1425 start_codon:yes stop_codon:yes gene_type:complete